MSPRAPGAPGSQPWRYGLLGLPLAFVALPLYVSLPAHYAREHGVALGLLGLLLLAARCVDALADPWIAASPTAGCAAGASARC